MSRKVSTGKSAEQRRAEMESLQDSISEQVETLRDSGAWQRYLDFARSFHRYSINNLLLILSQKPEASHVAGYRTWQKLGRQVRKGERGIRIFGGRDAVTTEEDEKTGEEKQIRRRRFFPVSVFDMSQTDPTSDENDPNELAQDLEGGDPAGIYAAGADYLTGAGWTLTREAIPGETSGYTVMDGSKKVVVDADLSPAQAAKTLLHEAAHVLLHSDDEAGEYVRHRGIKETEAESVAYVTAGALGLDTSAYSIGYIAGWSDCEAETIKATASRVLDAAHTLTEALATN